MNASRTYRRKLLGYERNFHERIPKRDTFHEMYWDMATMKKSKLTKKKRNIAGRKSREQPDDNDLGKQCHQSG